MSQAAVCVPDPVSPESDDGLEPRLSPVEHDGRFLAWDLVDEWGAQSFPASDPPANW